VSIHVDGAGRKKRPYGGRQGEVRKKTVVHLKKVNPGKIRAKPRQSRETTTIAQKPPASEERHPIKGPGAKKNLGEAEGPVQAKKKKRVGPLGDRTGKITNH